MNIDDLGSATGQFAVQSAKGTKKHLDKWAGLYAAGAIITALGGGAGIAKMFSGAIAAVRAEATIDAGYAAQNASNSVAIVEAENDAAFAWVACVFAEVHVEGREMSGVLRTCDRHLVGYEHLRERLTIQLGRPVP